MAAMATRKVCIVGSAFRSSFVSMYRRRVGWGIVEDPVEADFLQFTGGADINPAIYGEEAHPSSYFNLSRDRAEIDVYKNNVGVKNMLGVCRGAQLLCALNGGTLYQDVDSHTTQHTVIDLLTEGVTTVSSVHHQMMRPSVGSQILAVSTPSRAAKRRFMSNGVEVVHTPGNGDAVEVEAVFWPDTNSLGFQPHPEFGPESCTDYYFELIERCYK